MSTKPTSPSLVENYFNLLKHLDTSSKKLLIDKLKKSITDVEDDQIKKKRLKKLFGAWKDDPAFDDMPARLKEERHFDSKDPDLD